MELHIQMPVHHAQLVVNQKADPGLQSVSPAAENQDKSERKEIEKRRENSHGQEDIDILQVIEKESDDEKNRNQAKKAREEIGKRSKRRR